MADAETNISDDREDDDARTLVGQRLKFILECRKGQIHRVYGHRINQKNLADVVGIRDAYVSKLVNGTPVRVGFEIVDGIARYLEVPVAVFSADYLWSDAHVAELCRLNDAGQEREWRAQVRDRIRFMLQCVHGTPHPDTGLPRTLDSLAVHVQVKSFGMYGSEDVKALVSPQVAGAERPSLASQYDLLDLVARWFGLGTHVLLPNYVWVASTIADEIEAADLLAGGSDEMQVWAARHGGELRRKDLLAALRAMRDYETAQHDSPSDGLDKTGRPTEGS